ncbi:MAG: N-acetylmuramoyl-L-alanine amidase family protein, partial [Myxococcota bacterium]
LYVYDVLLRVRRALGQRTRAQVLATTRDGTDFRLVEREKLPFSRGHAVLTTPPYPIADATIGVHFRWYLANSLFRRHAKNGDSDRVVFVSIHADSLHPTLRGATVYVADAGASVTRFGKSGPVFTSRKEYREQPAVTFSLRERQKSEGRSHDLAQKIIDGFRGHDLAVHPFQPVRNRIFRGRRPWVPAVLRYNAVPAKVLLEICNLANDEDRRLLQQSAFRETIAAAIVDGILRYFGEAG